MQLSDRPGHEQQSSQPAQLSSHLPRKFSWTQLQGHQRHHLSRLSGRTLTSDTSGTTGCYAEQGFISVEHLSVTSQSTVLSQGQRRGPRGQL